MLVLRLSVLFVLVAVGGCFCAPQKAGDSCDLAAAAQEEPCPDGLLCQPFEGEDGGRCHVVVGGTCDADADEAFCADGSACAGGGGEGEGDDAICGGRGAGCAEARQCAGNNTCAEIESGGERCEPRVILRGTVQDGLSGEPIEGANVIALDAQGTAITPVAISNADGAYALKVPAKRNDDGSPVDGLAVTLRASAQDYATFPGGLRTALPIDLDTAVEADGAFTVDNALTVIALLALPAGEQGRPAVRGVVNADDAADRGGVLVVAEGAVAASAVSDADGSFVIFNVGAGAYTVRGYAAGLQLVPVDITVADDDVDDVVLEPADTPTGSVSGSVQIVNASGSLSTSVVLVVASTFDDTFVRGEVPRGLRAPGAGPPTVDGDFTIAGVPDGDYIVLAAFENDQLVRDPDESISGTDLVSVSVPTGGERDVEMPESFKITEALAVVKPGAEEPEVIDTPTPDFVFADDSSEDSYRVVVFDAFGNETWSTTVEGVSGSDDVTVPYAGPALQSGMVYQFRATSIKDGASKSTTEDLRGVFQYVAP